MSEYPRCATCRWWEPEGYVPNAAALSGRWGSCRLTEMDSDGMGDGQRDWNDRNSLALAACGGHEPDVAGLETHETFGCVQHEPKP